jgi:uncharacterized RmlC-like cupin family protein
MDSDAAVPTGPECRIIRSAWTYEGKQGPTYAGGVTAQNAGSQGLWFGMITIAPGARTKAHYHASHETALYLLDGEADVWWGPELARHEVMRTGDYLYIPAGVSHVAVNRSQTAPAQVIGARTDPNEQESVVLQPELDHLVP